MQVELKKIKISHGLSEETVAFTADVYIDGKLAAFASNRGHGGNTDITAAKVTTRQLVLQAADYYDNLPDKPCGDLMIKQSLDSYIDDIVAKKADEELLAKEKKKMQKEMLTAILVGVPDAPNYTIFGYKVQIINILATDKGKEVFTEHVAKRLRELKEGEIILNNNIPQEILDAAQKLCDGNN